VDEKGVDIAWPDLQLSLRDATAAASAAQFGLSPALLTARIIIIIASIIIRIRSQPLYQLQPAPAHQLTVAQ